MVFDAMPEGDTPLEQVEAAIVRVADTAVEWAALPVEEKRGLFKECLLQLRAYSDEVDAAACASRGYDPDDPADLHLTADATVLSSVCIAAWLRGGIQLFDELRDKGHAIEGKVIPRPDGTSRVRYEPHGKDWMLGQGVWEVVVRGEVRQADPRKAEPSVTGILGAGNTEILNDIVDSMCRLNSVVVYKSNPVLEPSNRVKERILAPLINRNFLAFVYGNVEQGKAVVESDRVDRLVMTGSHITFDRIVWGSQDKNDLEAKPTMTKPMMSELGSVNPHIVIPGDACWAQKDVDAQAEALIAAKLVNNGHVCASPQVLVTCRQWPQRLEFLDAVKAKIKKAPLARCFYPGIERQYDYHLEQMGEGVFMQPVPPASDEGGGGWTPLIFQEDLKVGTDGRDTEPAGMTEEAFCPVLYEVALDVTPDLPTFLPAAVALCHDKMWGNLTATLVVDDKTLGKHREHFETALDSMRFGAIGVNCPASLANASPLLTWGGFPGNTDRDVQSGIGLVGNFGCYEHVEKTIMFNKFRNFQTFRLYQDAEEVQLARERASRVAAVFSHKSWRNVFQLANIEMAAAQRHRPMRKGLSRWKDKLRGRPAY